MDPWQSTGDPGVSYSILSGRAVLLAQDLKTLNVSLIEHIILATGLLFWQQLQRQALVIRRLMTHFIHW